MGWGDGVSPGTPRGSSKLTRAPFRNRNHCQRSRWSGSRDWNRLHFFAILEICTLRTLSAIRFLLHDLEDLANELRTPGTVSGARGE